MLSAPPSRGHATIADLLAIPEEERYHELIGGELVRKANPTFEHGSAQAKLSELVGPFHRRGGGDRGPGGWWFALETEIRFTANTVLRPDAAGWRRDRVPERPTGFPLTVLPDWVCEVLSPSNAGNDLVRKLRVYHQGRVEHYWIVDPVAGTLVVDRWTEEGYITVLAAERGESVRAEPFGAIAFAVSELFGEEP